MSRFKLLYFVIFIVNVCITNAQISDKRLCVDEECKVPVSKAKTLLRYSSPDTRILSFAPNVDITIYSKSAGSRADLWGGEINGKRGYVPKHLVRETQVLKKPTILVDTELGNDTQVPLESVSSKVEPSQVENAFEVVDGTTIYLSPQDSITPSSTEDSVQSTALPKGEDHKTESLPNQSDEGATEKIESVVSDVISKVSNWINDNSENGENDDSEDEYEEDEADVDGEEDLEDPTDVDDTVVQAPEILKTGDDTLETKQDNDKPKIVPFNSVLEDSEVTKQTTDSVPESTESQDVSQESLTTVSPVQPEVVTTVDQVNVDQQILPETINVSANEAAKIPTEPLGDVGEINNVELNSKEQDVASIPQEDSLNLETTPTTQSVDNTQEVETPEPIPVSQEIVTPNEDLKTVQEGESLHATTTADVIPPVVDLNSIVDDQVLKIPEATPSTIETSENKENSQEVKIPDSTYPESRGVDENPEMKIQSEIPTGINQESVEVTTLSPEFEIPAPLEVTENPMETTQFISEEIVTPEKLVPTLPPLGLFGGRSDEKYPIVNNEENNNDNIASIEVSQEITTDGLNESIELNGSNESENSMPLSDGEEISTIIQAEVPPNQSEDIKEERGVDESDASAGSFFANVFSFFENTSPEEDVEVAGINQEVLAREKIAPIDTDYCDSHPTECQKPQDPVVNETKLDTMEIINFNSDMLLYLATTAISVIIFLFGYIALAKNRREAPLIAKINKLEKDLLILVKENQVLQEKGGVIIGDASVSNELVENLKLELAEVNSVKSSLEEQIQSLEKELENSTEVGMELNRMLTEILSAQGGSDVLKANVEHLQRQLVEQQSTIQSVNEALAITNTENHELKLELELMNRKVVDLQAEIDKLLLNILKIEKERDLQMTTLEDDVTLYRQKYEEVHNKLQVKENELNGEIAKLKHQLNQTERNLELKTNELDVLTKTIKELKLHKNNEEFTKSLLNVTGVQAELQFLKSENEKFTRKLQIEVEAKMMFEKRAQAAVEEAQKLNEKYEEADKLKMETQTKLEVLSTYFKDREAQLQKEISKHESLWVEKQGEATSTTERIKFLQEQLQNYKLQNESLKQEIMSQEVELKSQISVLEKKAHESWVGARQAERKLEDAKQEAAQLRNRLVLKERAIQEEKGHRLQSPIDQNGDIPGESPASPPLLFGTRDHITKSPLMPGLPPFLPPPPGVPFMPPPPLHGVPPFIPPPPSMFPGDHRPPPLGRMSSPPINSRYSPSSRGYSPYDRHSSSPSDSEYGTSPPQRRGFSPYNNRNDDRRDFKRPPVIRSNGRNNMKGTASSGSGNSNESLEKINRQQSKV